MPMCAVFFVRQVAMPLVIRSADFAIRLRLFSIADSPARRRLAAAGRHFDARFSPSSRYRFLRSSLAMPAAARLRRRFFFFALLALFILLYFSFAIYAGEFAACGGRITPSGTDFCGDACRGAPRRSRIRLPRTPDEA